MERFVREPKTRVEIALVETHEGIRIAGLRPGNNRYVFRIEGIDAGYTRIRHDEGAVPPVEGIDIVVAVIIWSLQLPTQPEVYSQTTADLVLILRVKTPEGAA